MCLSYRCRFIDIVPLGLWITLFHVRHLRPDHCPLTYRQVTAPGSDTDKSVSLL
jgi:hypothetical protein